MGDKNLKAIAVRPLSRAVLFLPLSVSAGLYRRLYGLRNVGEAP